MWVLSQTTTTCADLTALDIEQNDVIENDTVKYSEFMIVGYSFNAKFVLARYDNLQTAIAVQNDILAQMRKGEPFYDLKNREAHILRG